MRCGAVRCGAVRCEECGTVDDGERGWRAYRLDEPERDEEPAVAFYCPACAEREFADS